MRGSGSGFNIQKQQVPVIHRLSVPSVVTCVDVIQQVVKLPLLFQSFALLSAATMADVEIDLKGGHAPAQKVSSCIT